MLIGYARTSTIEQVAGLEAQEVALGATGCTKLFAEQASSAVTVTRAITPLLLNPCG
jgi:DNA invertase Pin-like site-specific DNA recombinase